MPKTNGSDIHGEAPTTVHFTLQGKGGVGKSFVSSILAQYAQSKHASVQCFDTDPVNATFAQYRRLRAEHLNVLKRGTINEKHFDVLVERICKGAGTFIVDTGATTFVPLWNYMLENEVLRFLSSRGRKAYVHCVVTGGQAMSDTLNGFAKLAETTTEKNVIVWLNEYFGEVTNDGRVFEEFTVAQENAAKLLGSVLIRERNPNTFGDDLKHMLERRWTFEEAIQSDECSLVSKQRLEIVRRELFEQLDKLPLV
jgi:hypothetical protein